MAKFKANLRAWLISKLNTSEIRQAMSSQSMPSATNESVFMQSSVGTTWATIHTQSVNIDGYLVIEATSNLETASLAVYSDGLANSLAFAWVGARQAFYIPVKKGQRISVQGSNAYDITARICKTTGFA